jgi:hypothetical protein
MPFVLQQNPTYRWPLTLVIPTDGGKKEKYSFDALFRRIPQTRVNEIIKIARLSQESVRRRDDEDETQEWQDQEIARELMAGWFDVIDEKGEEVPFTTSTFNMLLELPTAASQIVREWFKSVEVAKRKN